MAPHDEVLALLRDGKAVDPELLKRALLAGVSFGVGRIGMLPAEAVAATGLVPIAIRLAEIAPTDQVALFLASAVLRRAGLFDAALEAAVLARRSAKQPAELAQCNASAGFALRAKGDTESALEAFQRAFEAERDPVYLMERFRVLADAGRWDDALRDFERYEAAAYIEDEDQAAADLVAEARDAGAPRPTEPPLDVIRRRALDHGALYPMRDASANSMRQIGESPGLRCQTPTAAGEAFHQGTITFHVDGPEGPSNRLCASLMLTGKPDPRTTEYVMVNAVPVRKLANGRTPYATWRMDGDVAVQALPPPAPAVNDWIESIADYSVDDFDAPTDFLDLWDAAVRRPPLRASARDWVAALVHPRMPIARGATGPEWVYRWQTVALIGLVHSEPGWAGTAKREALLALLSGVIDWPLAAAIRVAAEVALREPAATDELRDRLVALAPVLAHENNGAIPATLRLALEMLPFVPRDVIEELPNYDSLG